MESVATTTGVAQVSAAMQTVMTGTLWGLLLAGLAAACYFLVVHRPTNWLRWEAINASGWVIIVALFYLRSIVLLLLRGTVHWQGWGDSAASIGLLALVDLLLVARVASFLSYRRRYRADNPGATTRQHND